MTFASITSTLSQKIVQNSSAILTAAGVAGVVFTGILSARAAIRAHDDILAEEERRYVNDPNDPGTPLTAKEKVQLTWLHFVPPLSAGLVTIGCVISAQSINTKQKAALLSLYTLSDRALTEWRDKTRELQGDSKYAKIEEEIIRDRVANRDPMDDRNLLSDSRRLDEKMVECLDVWTDRYFWGNQNIVDAAVNAINAEINNNNYASLNMFYDMIGLGNVPMGDDFGWNLDHKLDVSYFYTSARDASPVMGVTFQKPPKQDYYSFR
jgi:hypothetical protein